MTEPFNDAPLPFDGRVPPQALEIEEAVLGAILIEAEAAHIGMERLVEGDFYAPAHRHIFNALKVLFEGQNPTDMITVENELREKGQLDAIGGPNYLSYLTRSVASSASIEYHIQILKEKSLKRNLIRVCNTVVKDAYDVEKDPFDLLDDAEKSIFDLSMSATSTSTQAISTLVKETIKKIEELRQKRTRITGVPTMLHKLDDMTAGWQKGDLIIVAARPSMGKTAFVLTVARNAALHPDPELRAPVAVFSLEMSSHSLVQRLLTMEARVDAQKVRTGQITNDEMGNLLEAANRLYKSKIAIDDTPGIKLTELSTKCRRLKKDVGLGLVIIDYLQLMTTGRSNDASREQEIAYISRGLKALAKDLDVPVIALSQLSRQVEQRGGDKRPQLSDLRESGSIEQDADVVCFLYRPEYYGIKQIDGMSTAGLAEVIIGKQRNGPVGSVQLHFINQYARFENLMHAGPDDGGMLQPVSPQAQMSDDDIRSLNAQYGKPKPAIPEDDAPF
jgi:replicative DNA helicase